MRAIPAVLFAASLFASIAQAADHVVLARNGPGGSNFSPSTLVIALGDTVTFKNDPAAPGLHNVVSDANSTTTFRCANGCDGDGGDGAPSTSAWSATVPFDVAGSTTFHCEIHGAMMAGSIQVAPPPAPILSLNPAVLYASVVEGTEMDSSFSIENTGNAPLEWFASVNPTSSGEPCDTPGSVDWLSISPIDGITQSDAASTVALHINGAILTKGSYSASVCIQNNDPDHIAALPVVLTVKDSDVIFSNGFDETQ